MKELKAFNVITIVSTLVSIITWVLLIYSITNGYFVSNLKSGLDTTIFYLTIIFLVLWIFLLLMDWFLLVFEMVAGINNSLFNYPIYYGLIWILTPFVIGLILQIIITYKLEKQISKTKI